VLFPPEHETIDKGHGRIETRRIWVSDELTADFLDFPHVKQVLRIERKATRLDGSPLPNRPGTEIVFAVTSADSTKASPKRLLELNREHWGIENKLHWVRDVTFDEDRSQVGRRSAAHAMASLRNIAINLLRVAGATNIAAALRRCVTHAPEVLRLIGVVRSARV